VVDKSEMVDPLPTLIADIAQLARAPSFQVGGCGFELHYPLKNILKNISKFIFSSQIN
jgi:hypothetical protein